MIIFESLLTTSKQTSFLWQEKWGLLKYSLEKRTGKYDIAIQYFVNYVRLFLCLLICVTTLIYESCACECHGFRASQTRWLFLRHFWPLLKQTSFFLAAMAVAKIGSNLKSTPRPIGKFSLPKLEKHSVEESRSLGPCIELNRINCFGISYKME